MSSGEGPLSWSTGLVLGGQGRSGAEAAGKPWKVWWYRWGRRAGSRPLEEPSAAQLAELIVVRLVHRQHLSARHRRDPRLPDFDARCVIRDLRRFAHRCPRRERRPHPCRDRVAGARYVEHLARHGGDATDLAVLGAEHHAVRAEREEQGGHAERLEG